MKKFIIISLSTLLVCTNLTSCNLKKPAKLFATKIEELFIKKESNSHSLLKKEAEKELDILLQKRKSQEDELKAFIEKKNRENIEPEQQIIDEVEEESQIEEIIPNIPKRMIINSTRNVYRQVDRRFARDTLTEKELEALTQKKNNENINPKQQPKNYTKTFYLSPALQTHVLKGTLDNQPTEIFFESVTRNSNAYTYSVKGKYKTKTSNDSFQGMLTINNKPIGDLCTDSETEINGTYDLYEEKGHFTGKFTACQNDTKLSKANFNGDWTKYSNGKKMPCSFRL